ncbi:hypothetical protein Rs2_27082 [Raphanus sativus]|nr:hypothetical protein Rs2_27082 [Raphanus sativus]
MAQRSGFHSWQSVRTRFVFICLGFEDFGLLSLVSLCGRRQCSRAGAIFKGLCSFPSFYSICAFIEGDGYKGLRRSSETSYSKDDKDSPGILGNKENLTYPKSSSEVENGNRFSRKLKNG